MGTMGTPAFSGSRAVPDTVSIELATTMLGRLPHRCRSFGSGPVDVEVLVGEDAAQRILGLGVRPAALELP
jgi:hypothetical protein